MGAFLQVSLPSFTSDVAFLKESGQDILFLANRLIPGRKEGLLELFEQALKQQK